MAITMITTTWKPRCGSRPHSALGKFDACGRAKGHSGWHVGERYRWSEEVSEKEK